MENNLHIRPVFSNAVRGYNKTEVNDYVTRTESEVEMILMQQNKTEAEKQELQEELELLKQRLESLTSENKELQEDNDRLRDTVNDLMQELQNMMDEEAYHRREASQEDSEAEAGDPSLNPFEDLEELLEQKENELEKQKLQTSVEELSASVEELTAENQRLKSDLTRFQAEDYDPEMVKEAIMNAQRMGKTIVDEAKQKNAALQKEYDQMMVEVLQFKKDITAMYQRHMTMLEEFPCSTEETTVAE